MSYSEDVYSIGPNTALKKISSGGTLETVLEERDAEISDLEAIRHIYLESRVSSEYSIDWAWSPAFEAAETFLVDDWEIPQDRLDRAFERLRTVDH